MALRYYKNGPQRTLTLPLANSTDTSITVSSVSGFPTQFPWTGILDPDQATEEVVDVTAAVGNVLTIVRGVDSTTAVAHAAGAVFYHGISARDAREANEHVNATANVHGRTGDLVDTASVQTITGRKIFDDLETTGGGDVVTLGGSQTITGQKTFTLTPTTASNGDVATLGGSQTFSGAKTFGNTTHTGTETHSGSETHSGAVSFTGSLSSTQALSAPEALKTSAYTGTTDANGFVTLTHGAGFTPSMVFAATSNPSGSFAVFWGADNITSTQVRLRFMNANGGFLVSLPVAGRLFCVRP